MKQLAPNWYVQISPTTEASAATVQTTLKFASRERLKRELAAFLEAASRLRPLVLFFDDLHWADASTMDLLAYVADKFDSMRLLIVAAYRPEELLLYKHPFGPMKLDLQAHRRCRDIELGFLSREDVENYLEIEFPRHHFPLAFSKL